MKLHEIYDKMKNGYSKAVIIKKLQGEHLATLHDLVKEKPSTSYLSLSSISNSFTKIN